MINGFAEVPWKDSVGVALFRAVFLVYCLVAISTTAMSLAVEYEKSRQAVDAQLQLLQRAFEKSLIRAVWELDQPQIWSIMNGMEKNPVVVGVTLIDPQGQIIGRVGQVPQEDTARSLTHMVSPMQSLTRGAIGTDAPLRRYSFDLHLDWEGKRQWLGTAHLYWSHETILQEVRFEFYLIVIGALVKTIALWAIFIYYARFMLQHPLKILTGVARRLNHPHLDLSMQRLVTKRFNEFNILENCFQEMALRLHTAYAGLQETNCTLRLEIEERRKSEAALFVSRERLQKLSRYLEDVRELEQKRLASEIHDELGSTLTAAKISLSILGRRQQNDANRQRCQEIYQLIDDALRSVRRIARSLRPNVLDRMGLRAALEELAGFTKQHAGLHCRLDSEEQEWLMDEARRTALFRIAQESLTNVVRHAEASKVVMALREEEGTIILEVSDDGCGIAMERAQDAESCGLAGMRERAERLGGSVSVAVVATGGTCVTARIPLAATEEVLPG